MTSRTLPEAKTLSRSGLQRPPTGVAAPKGVGKRPAIDELDIVGYVVVGDPCRFLATALVNIRVRYLDERAIDPAAPAPQPIIDLLQLG
jgi:hypothetical protein